ncbi:MAG TPA: HNH endonuclease [Pyrinomonadaceae bacterium]|nr:HNH endonuclease [Pyrinomonadaceae bacterium]
MTETWKPVLNFEGIYEVSSLGRVRRSLDSPTGGIKAGHILTPSVMRNGYLFLHLSKNGVPFGRYVHRLVCEAFYGEPPSRSYQAAHQNGIRTDNRVENLRWATVKENHADMDAHGTRARGERAPTAKLSDKEIEKVFLLRAEGLTQREIGSQFGISQGHISDILCGKKRKGSNASNANME